MGPRPDGRGKRAPRASAWSKSWRQWGRGQTAAERSAWCSRIMPSIARRQWGRGQTAAERRRPSVRAWPNACVNGAAERRPRKGGRRVPVAHLVICVNGAAARRPRKDALSRYERNAAEERQWGRGQTAAERVIPTCRLVMIGARQWGRGQTAAESTERMPRPSAPPPSMGPRPDGRGKSAFGPSRCVVVSVNGAAARRPRKVCSSG